MQYIFEIQFNKKSGIYRIKNMIFFSDPGFIFLPVYVWSFFFFFFMFSLLQSMHVLQARKLYSS